MSNTNTAIATAMPAEQEVVATVNQKHLFATMKNMFDGSFSLISELMQNARRAGATYVAFGFTPEERTLTISDNGCGIEDFGKLLALCESGWDEQTTLSDNPFGMGFFSVFFACDKVIVRSKGLRLEATHDDIVAQRKLVAAKDEMPITTGTLLELHGLRQELLEKTRYVDENKPAYMHYQLYGEVQKLARGFTIPVHFNGEEIERPHALDKIETVLTPIGRIHDAMVLGGEASTEVNPTYGTYGTYCALYLQGLPIQRDNVLCAKVIVHLDSIKFEPVMPDRKSLYNAQEQLKLVDEEHKRLVQRFLVEEKAKLDGKDFVLKHWKTCKTFGCRELLNDIPYLPYSTLCLVENVAYSSEDTFSRGYRRDELVFSREDVVSGKLVMWRGVEAGPDNDEQNNTVLLKIMQRKGIYDFDDCGNLNPGHWIYELVRDVNDFEVEVEPAPIQGSLVYSEWCNESVNVCLVDNVKVTITSTVDRHFRLEEVIENDWLLHATPDDPKFEYFCYVTKKDLSPDSPAEFLSGFMDEHDVFRDDWRDEAVDLFNSLWQALKGANLAQQVQQRLSDMNMRLGDKNAGQMALLYGQKRWMEHNGIFSDPWLQVFDLEADEFWEELLGKIAATDRLNAASLKAAFMAAASVKPTDKD